MFAVVINVSRRTDGGVDVEVFILKIVANAAADRAGSVSAELFAPVSAQFIDAHLSATLTRVQLFRTFVHI